MTPPPAPVAHGTTDGYAAHLARGDLARWAHGAAPCCEPCIAAHNRHTRLTDRHRARPAGPVAAWRKHTGGVVPNAVLGVLLLHVPEAIEDWAIERLPAHAVDRALWWAQHTDYPTETAS